MEKDVFDEIKQLWIERDCKHEKMDGVACINNKCKYFGEIFGKNCGAYAAFENPQIVFCINYKPEIKEKEVK